LSVAWFTRDSLKSRAFYARCIAYVYFQGQPIKIQNVLKRKHFLFNSLSTTLSLEVCFWLLNKISSRLLTFSCHGCVALLVFVLFLFLVTYIGCDIYIYRISDSFSLKPCRIFYIWIIDDRCRSVLMSARSVAQNAHSAEFTN
jgi:hypothetical protein